MTMSEKESEEFRILVDGIRDRREARERNEFRRSLASKIKPVALAASATPYDAGLGDVAYAAGELIDPEGDPELAAMAAGIGLLTGGAGSGAMAARMVGRSAKSKKATGLLNSHPTIRDRIKNLDPMRRTDAPYPMKRPDAPYARGAEELYKKLPKQVKDEEFKKIKSYLARRRREELERRQRASDRQQAMEALAKQTDMTRDALIFDPHKDGLIEAYKDLASEMSSAGDDGHITDDMIIDYMSSKNILP